MVDLRCGGTPGRGRRGSLSHSPTRSHGGSEVRGMVGQEEDTDVSPAATHAHDRATPPIHRIPSTRFFSRPPQLALTAELAARWAQRGDHASGSAQGPRGLQVTGNTQPAASTPGEASQDRSGDGFVLGARLTHQQLRARPLTTHQLQQIPGGQRVVARRASLDAGQIARWRSTGAGMG